MDIWKIPIYTLSVTFGDSFRKKKPFPKLKGEPYDKKTESP